MGERKENREIKSPESLPSFKIENKGIPVDGCDGCHHPILNKNGFMTGCDMGKSDWKMVNERYKKCKIAYNEYRNGHLK